MTDTESLILSIRQFDPIGGIFVDRPEDLEDGEASAATFRFLAALPSAIAPQLLRIGPGTLDGWTPSDRLAALSDELERLTTVVASPAGEGKERAAVAADLRKLAAAVATARSIPQAGLNVG